MNKILVLVYVPLIDKEYDVFIPSNQKIGIVKKYLISSIMELSNIDNYFNENFKLYDKNLSICYDNNIYVKNSGIINGAKLVLM